MSRFLAVAVVIVIALLGIAALIYVPLRARQLYGPPAESLGFRDRLEYSARLLWYGGTLTQPLDSAGAEQPFHVDQGESVAQIAGRLEAQGLVFDSGALVAYLTYTGLDTTIQAGDYQLSPALSAVDIAHHLQDATPEDVMFVVLAGWRAEEVADSLATSGLAFSPEEFMTAVRSTPSGYDYFPYGAGSEGFLLPDTYILPRVASANELRDALVRNFALHLTVELKEGFARQGLSVYQAVTLASLVEREAVWPEEQSLIASVFLNRLNAGIKLDSDATVQYALGYDPIRQTWWTNPLSALDLQIDSPYNTYKYPGLPPGPIANSGLDALHAVAFPESSPYFYFRARCDASGFHAFAETFEEHLANGCP
jgi:UPF0755 protein